MVENVRKNVLILGSGMVSAPLVEYLYKDKNIAISICSAITTELHRLESCYPGIKTKHVDVLKDSELFTKLCTEADIVVSLLPNHLQYVAAEECVKLGKNLVTASYARYASSDIEKLHETAKAADIILLNEIGLDPGIDHMLALQLIHDLKSKQGKIESFTSFCGGLPALENANNPLRYKFSWSPRGTLANTIASAKYLWNGDSIDIPSGGEVISSPMELDFLEEYDLEGFANGDSTEFSKLYQIDDTVHSFLRGTLRYKGFSRNMKIIHQIGLLDMKPHPLLLPKAPNVTWKELMLELLDLHQQSEATLHHAFVEKLGSQTSFDFIKTLGLLEDVLVLKMTNLLDTFCLYLSKHLAFASNERDLIIMQIECVVRWPDDSLEKHILEFSYYGDTAVSNGHSTMAKTVGYPTAIATKMILNNEIAQRGVVLPLTPNIYEPILRRLADKGIVTSKRVLKLN